MAEFSTVQSDFMIAAAQAGADGVADVLKRTFDQDCKVTPNAEAEAFLGADALVMSGRCLVLQVQVEGGVAAAVLPGTAGLAPTWAGAADESQQAKLGTLAQEFFASVLPEDFPPIDQRVDFVDDVKSIDLIAFSDSANFVRFGIEGPAGKGDILLIWPAKEMADLPPGTVGEHELVAEVEAAALREEQQAKEAAFPDAAPNSASGGGAGGDGSSGPRIQFTTVAEGLRKLPTYARNLMKIPVNVSAVLAAKKMSVADVHELSPGSIIEFDKSCEETLTLEVGDQMIAEGEAVRVGERFGIWVTQIALPEERFSCANRPPRKPPTG